MSSLSLLNRGTGQVVVPDLRLATTFWRRFRGLQFRRSLAEGEGLLLVPCRSVHTHWMRFAISIAAIDEQGVVLEHRASVAPWRIVSAPPATRAILEAAAGALPVTVGDALTVVRSAGSPDLPAAVRFLQGSDPLAMRRIPAKIGRNDTESQ